MDLIVYLNGDFVKTGEAKVSIYDRGFLYGDSVFETIRAYNCHIFKFQEHIQRLYNSLKDIGMTMPVSPNMIYKAIKLLLQYNQIKDAYIRVTITRGEAPIGLNTSLCSQPTVLIVVEPLRGYPQQWYLNGISLVTVSQRKIPEFCIPSTLKSSNYLVNILAKKEALSKGAQDALLLNLEGYVAESTTSNIFLIKDKSLLTPALSSGILGGITRQTVLELAENRRMDITQRHILPEEIFRADECFLTSTIMEIMPVIYCDGTQINKGQPGKITRLLMKDYKKMVDRFIEQEKTAKV